MTRSALSCLLLATALCATDIPHQAWLQSTTASESGRSTFYWKEVPVGPTAELLTLFCHSCQSADSTGQDVPLVTVLRDTASDDASVDSRISYVWLLTYTKLDVGKRILAATPFFYWRVGDGAKTVDPNDTAPLLNLTAVQHPVASELGRNILQWAWLDPSITPIRATSRAYKSNDTDHERLHLEEAISYLREAPVDQNEGLTAIEMNTVVARLELRKKLLGGLATESRAAKFGEEESFNQERVRSRNWELLRQCAERTGLIFEPIDLAGTTGQYGVLWFPLHEKAPQAGTATGEIWKLLNIRDPWTDERLDHWRGLVSRRPVNGTDMDLVPLGVYNLNYPKLPLLLIDFRDRLHIRRHEMTQRTINEVTAGVIGISHFTNWYYYVAADLYGFIAGRHGAAMDEAERLDCYAQFRVQLALDNQMDPALRKEMQRREDSFAVNPLESSPAAEVAAATERYQHLEQDARDGKLEARLDRDRRAELAADRAAKSSRVFEGFLHEATLGLYTKRAPVDAENVEILKRYRGIQDNLGFLESVVKNGTEPEVAYSTDRIQSAVSQLSDLLQGIRSAELHKQAEATIERVRSLSRDEDLRRDCSFALAGLQRPHSLLADSDDGVAAEPRPVAEAMK